MFWITATLLFFLAALFVIVPLWWRSQSESENSEELRKSTNIALFQERSDELESELAVGNIDQQQFDSLLLEFQQNLLADVDAIQSDSDSSATGSKKKKGNGGPKSGYHSQRWNLTYSIPLALSIIVPLIAFPLYNQWGFHDDVVVMDLFQATVDNQNDPKETRRLIFSIGEFAESHPDMPWPQYFLAENVAAMGMFSEAQEFYSRAAELLEPSPEKALVLGRVATFMYLNSEFEITPEVQAVIDETRAMNPGEISILQLLATDAEQRQDLDSAIDYWRLLIQAAPNSEMAAELRIRISAAQRRLAANDPDAEQGPVLEVSVALGDGIELDSGLRVFIAARNAEREGMPPLAAMDTVAGQLPTTVRLDNSLAVGPFNLSTAETIYVSVLVSFAGVATPGSGDYRVVSEAFALSEGQNAISLVVNEQVP